MSAGGGPSSRWPALLSHRTDPAGFPDPFQPVPRHHDQIQRLRQRQPTKGKSGLLLITTIELDRYFHITGRSRAEIEESINTVVETARVHSMREGWQGILVTRHEPGLYTVNVSGDVPYGVTMERDAAAPELPHIGAPKPPSRLRIYRHSQPTVTNPHHSAKIRALPSGRSPGRRDVSKARSR